MSILKKNITAQRIGLLAAKKEIIFHIDDLANLWGIKKPSLLRTTLMRYVRSGLLHRIYRGFYSLLTLDDINPVLLGAKALHNFCYLTTETILYNTGYLSQKPLAYTFVSEKSSRFHFSNHQFISRQLNPKFLYHPEGILLQEGINQATPARAIADMLYFNSKTHFDKPVDWKAIYNIQKTISYPLTPQRYDFTKS